MFVYTIYVEYNLLMQTKTPSTPQAAATGGKTLFMGNLSFSVEESDVYVYQYIMLSFVKFYKKIYV